MGIEEPKFNLHEMQMYLEEKIHDVRTICDLELSENDYRRLGIKLKSLFAFANNRNFAEDFMLCIAVYWTYDFIYWNEKYARFDTELIQMYEELSQYTQRYQLMMLKECFHDFGLNSYQVDSGNLMQDCFRIIVRHAGIPKEETVAVLDLIDRYISEDSDVIIHTVQPFLPRKTAHIFSYMDEAMQLEVLDELKELLTAVEESDQDEISLCQRFPASSLLLIRETVRWQKCRELRKCSV